MTKLFSNEFMLVELITINGRAFSGQHFGHCLLILMNLIRGDSLLVLPSLLRLNHCEFFKIIFDPLLVAVRIRL